MYKLTPSIPLDEIEEYIPVEIYLKASRYLDEILELEEIYEGIYEGVVSGTEDYQVNLEINQRVLVACYCDCPYDKGLLCKHIVACVLYLTTESIEGQTSPPPKKPNVAEEVEAYLSRIPQDELKKFLQQALIDNSSLRTKFFRLFMDTSKAQNQDYHVREVDQIIQKWAFPGAYLNNETVEGISDELQELLDIAGQQIAKKQYEIGFNICKAILSKIAPFIYDADDSLGYFNDLLLESLDFLGDIAFENPPTPLKNKLFTFCIEAYTSEEYHDWGFETRLLEIALQVAETEAQYQSLLAITTRPTETEFESEELDVITFDILEKIKDYGAAKEFALSKSPGQHLRQKLIEDYLEQEDFDKVAQLALEGTVKDKDRGLLVNTWYRYLLRIAQWLEKTEHIIEYAHYLWLNDPDDYDSYYYLLKETLPPAQWESFVQKMIQETQNNYSRQHLEEHIYIQEEKWELLWKYLQKDPSLHHIQRLESYLAPIYPERFFLLYGQQITKFIDSSSSRGQYQQAAHYLKRMQKLGAEPLVVNLIEQFIQEHPRRRAMKEELDRLLTKKSM